MREDLLDHQLLKNRGHDLELTASLHKLRLLWGRQIAESTDWPQSFPGIRPESPEGQVPAKAVIKIAQADVRLPFPCTSPPGKPPFSAHV